MFYVVVMFEVQQNLLIQMQYVPCQALPLGCYLASYRLVLALLFCYLTSFIGYFYPSIVFTMWPSHIRQVKVLHEEVEYKD